MTHFYTKAEINYIFQKLYIIYKFKEKLIFTMYQGKLKSFCPDPLLENFARNYLNSLDNIIIQNKHIVKLIFIYSQNFLY